jgi:hypothetical protein
MISAGYGEISDIGRPDMASDIGTFEEISARHGR